MGRMVKRLSQLEIDEVSLVDRPANQYGLVAIAKNHQEDDMPDLFDDQGNPVDESELQHGDYVYDEAGNEYAYTESDPEEDGYDGYDGAEEYAEDGELVGKALLPISRSKVRAAGRLGRMKAKDARRTASTGLQYAGRRAEQGFDNQMLATQMFLGRQGRRGARAASAGLAPVGAHFGRNKDKYLLAGAGAAGGYGGSRVGKSFGGEVLEALSKALNDDERDTVISKAMDVVEDIAKRNEQLEEIVAELLDDREGQDFYEIAKSYEVPVETDELAGVLHRASQYLPDEDLEVLDRVLSGASEITKSYFEEIGYGGPGGSNSDVMDQIAALADEAVVSKGLGESGLTREQAVAALFENNPEAYDQYLAETR